jgi:hypothetical protein
MNGTAAAVPFFAVVQYLYSQYNICSLSVQRKQAVNRHADRIEKKAPERWQNERHHSD